MSKAFHLQILSPAKQLVDEHVRAADLPGAEGDFTLLPDHAPLVSMLRPGILHVYMADGNHRSFFAATGYVDMKDNHCTILSDHVQDTRDINKAEAAEALAAAERALANAKTNKEMLEAEHLITTARRLMNAARV